MPSPKKSAIPADKLALYDALIKSVPQIERKGAAHPYTSLNGHMFTYLDQTGTLGLRLPADALKTFLSSTQAPESRAGRPSAAIGVGD